MRLQTSELIKSNGNFEEKHCLGNSKGNFVLKLLWKILSWFASYSNKHFCTERGLWFTITHIGSLLRRGLLMVSIKTRKSLFQCSYRHLTVLNVNLSFKENETQPLDCHNITQREVTTNCDSSFCSYGSELFICWPTARKADLSVCKPHLNSVWETGVLLWLIGLKPLLSLSVFLPFCTAAVNLMSLTAAGQHTSDVELLAARDNARPPCVIT